ncbi:MAG: uracil-DNA glycosylase family protein [Ginsengibacter sp.]
MTNFAENILQFIQHLDFKVIVPDDIQVMNPFLDPETLHCCNLFYKKYYNDSKTRHMIIGINPGRFGGGVTGIPFTDPARLQINCGIENSWMKKQELSSVFIYDVINGMGGPEHFYERFYITAVSPLGFTRQNKNLNYYDDKLLQSSIKNFVTGSMARQLQFPIKRDVAFCLGHGKNYQYLSLLNKEMGYFQTIIPLPHPRFIMQYKLKKKPEYIRNYIEQLRTVINN